MRLIDADALQYRCKDYGGYADVSVEKRRQGIAYILKEDIDSAPTIDPVKHGKWIFDPDGMDWGIPAWKCSECHGRNSMIPTYIRGKGKMIKVEHPLRWEGSKFCPNCGAKMDMEGK